MNHSGFFALREPWPLFGEEHGWLFDLPSYGPAAVSRAMGGQRLGAAENLVEFALVEQAFVCEKPLCRFLDLPLPDGAFL